ncbi:MAG: helix-turn-helix transcriptional regulator [Chloroflexota bacterium]|jgi:putative transcriptional regulator
MALTTRIREYRARKELSQDELARRVGVRRETIVHLEKGRYNPSLKLAWDIARALDATIDELFCFTDE